MGIKSLHRERISERNGWITCWVITGADYQWAMEGLWRQSGFCNMTIIKAVPSSASSKELKTTVEIVFGDLVSNSVRILHLHLCSWDFFLKGAHLMRWCFPWSLCCVLAYMPESRSFIPTGGLITTSRLFSTSQLQIAVGWTLSRTTDVSSDGFTETFCPGLCNSRCIYKKNYLINSRFGKSTSLFNFPPCYLWNFPLKCYVVWLTQARMIMRTR